MKQQFDQAQANFDQQKSRVAELTAQLQVAEIPLGRDDELRAAVSEVNANQAALAQAQWKLDQKTLVAPTAALVADTYFNPGEMSHPGQAVVSLLPPAQRQGALLRAGARRWRDRDRHARRRPLRRLRRAIRRHRRASSRRRRSSRRR